MKAGRSKQILVSVLLILPVLGIGLYGLVEPRTPIGHAVFYTCYTPAPTRSVFLKSYSWVLRECNGGYVPPAINDFLLDRTHTAAATREADGIVDFWIKQGSGRWSVAPSKAEERLKTAFITNIFRRLDRFSDRDAKSALVFVEELRTGIRFYKGGFDRHHPELFDLELAKASFCDWWSDGENWPENRDVNPLAGTEMTIEQGN